MATHSSILAWKTPWVEEAGGLESMGCKESDMTEQLASIHFTSTLTPGAVGLAGMHLGWDFSPSAALALDRNMYVRGTLCFMLQAKWTPRCLD